METMKSSEIPPGTIVVGVDGSPSAREALGWALEQAIRENRDLTLVHVPEVSPYLLAAAGQGSVLDVDLITMEGRQLLEHERDRAVRLLGASEPDRELTVHTLVQLGDPRTVLIDLSARAACVVLGSRGRGTVASLLLGSVGVAVTDKAACPVAVFRPRKRGVVRQGVLVGVDGTPTSQPALEYAYRQASLYALPLKVLHCFIDMVGVTHKTRVTSIEDEGLEERRLLLSEAMAGMGEKYPDVRVGVEVCRGFAEDCLVEQSSAMDLVVVGTAPMSWIAGLVASDVSRRVVEHASTVVMVVPVGWGATKSDGQAP